MSDEQRELFTGDFVDIEHWRRELEAKLGVTWDEALEMHVPVGDPVCACPINRRLERIDARARELQAELEAAGLRSRMNADQGDAADRAWDRDNDA